MPVLSLVSGGQRMYFEASKEAAKIESMAKERIDTDDTKSKTISRELSEEWLSLTPEQRNLVGQALEDKYQNSALDTLPVPHIEHDQSGNCTGVVFTAASLDLSSGPHEIYLHTLTPTTGGRVVELMSSDSSDHDFHRLDYMGFDSPATKHRLEHPMVIGPYPHEAAPAGTPPNASVNAPAANGGGVQRHTASEAGAGGIDLPAAATGPVDGAIPAPPPTSYDIPHHSRDSKKHGTGQDASDVKHNLPHSTDKKHQKESVPQSHAESVKVPPAGDNQPASKDESKPQELNNDTISRDVEKAPSGKAPDSTFPDRKDTHPAPVKHPSHVVSQIA